MKTAATAIFVFLSASALMTVGHTTPTLKKAAPESRIAFYQLERVAGRIAPQQGLDPEMRWIYQDIRVLSLDCERLVAEAENKATGPDRQEEIYLALKEAACNSDPVYDSNGIAYTLRCKMARLHDDRLAMMYDIIAPAVTKYAESRGLDLVMQMMRQQNIRPISTLSGTARKIRLDALVPGYAAPGVDISEDLARFINEERRAAKGVMPRAD